MITDCYKREGEKMKKTIFKHVTMELKKIKKRYVKID